MGRINDLREEMQKDEQAPAAIPQAAAPAATAVLEPPVIPAPPATSDTPNITEPTPAPAPAGETVSKEEYDKAVALTAQLLSELERQKAARATLEGKYKAEVPALHDKVKDLEAQIAASPTSKSDGSGTNPNIASIKDEFGDEIGNVIEGLQNEINELKAKKPAIVDEPPPTAAASAPSNDFISALTIAYPNWMYINGHKELNIPANAQWPVFLAQPSNVQGLSNQQLLDIHVNNKNAAGAAEIFKTFVATPAPKAATGAITGAEAFIDPATTGGGNSSTPQGGNQPVMLHGYNINSMEDQERYKQDRIRRRLVHLTQAEVESIADGFDNAFATGRLR